MSTPCTCGANGGAAAAQPKKLLKRRSTKKGDPEMNPYSGRGVEKFAALLAEIEEKKRLVYSEFDPEEVSLIRFVHAGDNKLNPLVVRANSSNKLASKRKEFEAGNVEMEEEKVVEGDQDGDASGLAEDQDKEEKVEKVEIVDEEKKMVVPWMSYKVGGVVVLVVVMVAVIVVFGRSWKSYCLLQIQGAVCPKIQTE